MNSYVGPRGVPGDERGGGFLATLLQFISAALVLLCCIAVWMWTLVVRKRDIEEVAAPTEGVRPRVRA